MPLHLTKVAFGAESVDHLAERLRLRGEEGPVFLTTRYLPKRHEEVAGQGSMFWILKHQLIARSPILGFGEAEEGRVAIHIDPKLVLVQAQPKRAHQGWRYLEGADAPLDLGGDATGLDVMPPALMTKLAELALI
ncbi:MAG: DUF1489 family protein [Sphingomonas sp.]|jgi:hypothetical protein|uniref:DUF1489 family protein n=1 Tax=Sphingomonas sp. Leaf208 TaxID=1735679 RepID=UPI000701797C|nr:DUF1489 domain-containing protein [Sphingomonas sp. Leaf208]KQM49214.1 hypothetical protein ASE69_10530 [Sphingomonas sp. Leaf208]RZM31786.1 MAG: DUF1489 family protein [Sphingomonas sp.]